MRVEVRGKVYESVAACAKALGVSKDTVYCAVSRRTTDTLGLGKGNRTARRGGKKPIPVKIGQVSFPSMAEASRQLGMNRRYVQTVLTKGKSASRQDLIRKVMEYAAEKERRKRKDREQ